MADVATLQVLSEFSVVLPQRYRARVLQVLPDAGRSINLLIQDFTRAKAETTRGPDFNELEPIWRLYRYEPPAAVATEVCVFTQPAKARAHSVFMARSDRGLYCLFDRQLLRVDVEERKVHGVARLHLPTGSDGTSEVRGLAISSAPESADVCAMTVDLGSDQLTVHWIPLEDSPNLGGRYAGPVGENIAFGPSGDLYSTDLLEVCRYRDARSVANRDIAPLFPNWNKSPTERICVAADGRVVVAGDCQLVVLSPDLEHVLAVHPLVRPPHFIEWSYDTGQLMMASLDHSTATLMVRTVEL